MEKKRKKNDKKFKKVKKKGQKLNPTGKRIIISHRFRGLTLFFRQDNRIYRKEFYH